MKKLTLFIVVICLSSGLLAQDVFVTKIEVQKGYPENPGNQIFSFELGMLTDISKFTYYLSTEKSVFTEIKDDTGYDLLAAQEKYEAEYKAQGYAYDALKMAYRAPISSGPKPGIVVSGYLHAIPRPGAKVVTLRGTIAMINVGEGENTFTLKDLPTQYEWGAPGVQTAIGEVKISQNGSFSTGDVTYTKYMIESEQPIVAVEVAGGDDREEARAHFDLGLYGNEVVFKNIPNKLDLVVTAKETIIEQIPFDIELTIGF
jgi:hypothetical protein